MALGNDNVHGPAPKPRRKIPRPLRNGIVIFLSALIIEYLVIPRFIVAGRSLHLLEQLNVLWLLAGIVLEAASLLSYALLTRTLLPKEVAGLWTYLRIDLATTAISHVIPGGTAASASLGYRLFTANGVAGTDAGFAMATQGMGSAVVLNILLWIALVISIPLAGANLSHHSTIIYATVALIGMFALGAIGALVFALTRGAESATRLVRALARRLPRISEDRLESLVRQVGESLRALSRDHEQRRRAVIWAASNWLLDAAALWSFLAALGRFVDPVELFVAYGVANVLAVIPITPGGLGFVEASSIGVLASFGVPPKVGTLAVIGWRLVNFWLPIPVGAACYVSLKVGKGSGLAARREALRGMAKESQGLPPGSEGVSGQEGLGSAKTAKPARAPDEKEPGGSA